MLYLTRYRDLATQVKHTKIHRTSRGRERWIRNQTAAGQIHVVETSERDPSVLVSRV